MSKKLRYRYIVSSYIDGSGFKVLQRLSRTDSFVVGHNFILLHCNGISHRIVNTIFIDCVTSQKKAYRILKKLRAVAAVMNS